MVTVDWGRRTVLSPLLTIIVTAGSLADNSAHLTDGLHTADQVLHNHNCFPPELSL